MEYAVFPVSFLCVVIELVRYTELFTVFWGRSYWLSIDFTSIWKVFFVLLELVAWGHFHYG